MLSKRGSFVGDRKEETGLQEETLPPSSFASPLLPNHWALAREVAESSQPMGRIKATRLFFQLTYSWEVGLARETGQKQSN